MGRGVFEASKRSSVRTMRLDELKAARRHVLHSLEEAPRYRDALRLLVQIVQALEDENKESSSSESQEPTTGDRL